MSRLDKYQSALLAAFPGVSDETLIGALDSGGPEFVDFVIDHGLGPQWHVRTGRAEFRDCRLAAEALFLAQEHALRDVDTALENVGIEYAVIKGAANRLLLYDNPAIRACHDLDLLVRPKDRVRAAAALVEAGFVAEPDAKSISRELLLTRGEVNVDLHWALLREGRLRHDPTSEMLNRRWQKGAVWSLSSEDALFVLLVHPAFAKHLGGWDMGLHRVMDIVEWLRLLKQPADWQAARQQLKVNGVQAAAWATLRWVALLSAENGSPAPQAMMFYLRVGRLRKAWLERWLLQDISARTSDMHWARLIGFTTFLHDTLWDSLRAYSGRQKARRRSVADLECFAELKDE